MGGTYSVPSPDYKFGESLPRSYDPPRPEDLPLMELVPVPEDNLEGIQLAENVKGALQESDKLLTELNKHVELNNLQEKTSEKNVLVFRDFAKHIQNQANNIINSHEEYDTNLQLVRYNIDNSSITKRNTNILLVVLVVFFVSLGFLIYFIRKKKILPIIKNKALNDLAK
jgi:hypothetical protein